MSPWLPSCCCDRTAWSAAPSRKPTMTLFSHHLMRHRFLLLAIATVLVLPLFLKSASLATEVLIFALAAVGCNLLLGYTGLMSFGQGIFLGLGSYAGGLALLH